MSKNKLIWVAPEEDEDDEQPFLADDGDWQGGTPATLDNTTLEQIADYCDQEKEIELEMTRTIFEVPKTCLSCGKRAEAGTTDAMDYILLTLKRPVFGLVPEVYVCRPSLRASCVVTAGAVGYVQSNGMTPRR